MTTAISGSVRTLASWSAQFAVGGAVKLAGAGDRSR
jgi:hypothetical protein